MTEDYPRPIGEPIIVPHEIVTLDQARELVEFEFSLPTWVPDGLVLQEDVRLNDVIGGPWLQWLDENVRGRSLNLTISEALPDVRYRVGPDSVTEITINGVPATLIRGNWWSDEQRWKDDGSRAIRWQIDGIQYYLTHWQRRTWRPVHRRPHPGCRIYPALTNTHATLPEVQAHSSGGFQSYARSLGRFCIRCHRTHQRSLQKI